jgi:hypothetical protein
MSCIRNDDNIGYRMWEEYYSGISVFSCNNTVLKRNPLKMISLSYSRIPEPVPFNPESSGKFEVFKKFRWTGTSGTVRNC